MNFYTFATDILEPIENTTKKLEQTEILAQGLKRLDPNEIAPALYLLLGQVGPSYNNPDFHFGLEFLLYSLAMLDPDKSADEQSLFGDSTDTALDKKKKQLKKEYKKLGDAGNFVEQSLAAFTETSVKDRTIQEVFDELMAVTNISGEGSQNEKIRHVADLLRTVHPVSGRYIARILMGDMRLGMSDKTVLDSVSWAVAGDKSLRTELDDIYQRHPDIGRIATVVLADGLDAAKHTLDAELGIPILPALCDRLKTSQEVIDKMGEVYVEPKYDGSRIQIHWNADTQQLHTFTRNLEESTQMFPELEGYLQQLDVRSCILDAEGVGYDPETDQLVPFQKTITRKRKHGIAAAAAEVPLRFFVFDILSKDGVSLLHTPLEQRRQILDAIMPQQQSDLVIAPTLRTTDPEELRAFHEQQLTDGLEGVVIKRVDGPYQAGRKGFNWVKFKEKEGTGAKLSDTIDAVVLGYYAGRGKRAAFGIGAFLVGVRDEDQDAIVTIAKIGTGLTDEQWREMKQRCDDLIASGSDSGTALKRVVPEPLEPDFAVPLGLVVEVAADEITQSPVHSAGIALRFPRLSRFRDDKSVDQATTREELKAIKVA